MVESSTATTHEHNFGENILAKLDDLRANSNFHTK